MALSPEQEDDVRKRAIDLFGEQTVRELDKKFFELHDLRMSCSDDPKDANYNFLQKMYEKYVDKDPILVLAACLYGMKLGELGREYAYRQERTPKPAPAKPLPSFGSAS